MDLSLKHDAAFCLVDHCPICEGATEKASTSTASGPNRFDPYEALDTIDAILDSSSNLPTHTARGDGYLVLDLDRETLCREAKALRAYITGMEK